jgi:HK97 family phage portal protein
MLLERLMPEPRAKWTAGTHPRDPVLAEILGGGNVTTSGENVTPTTALGVPAYYACVRNISVDAAKFPLKPYEDTGDNTRKLRSDLPAYRLVSREPNPEQTPDNFWAMLVHWALGWKRGVAWIETNGRGEPLALWPVHPSRVRPDRVKKDNRLIWRIVNESGQEVTCEDWEVFNLHLLGPDTVSGYQPTDILGESIGRAMAVQKFSSAFFGNGATLGVVFEHPGTLSEPAKKALRDSVREDHSTAGRAFRAFVVEEGMKLSDGSLGVDPEKAQMIETARFTVEDMARIFRCPVNKIQQFAQAKGWSTLDADEKAYYFETITPIHRAIEQESNRKLLPSRADNVYFRHTINFLLYADPDKRAAFLKILFENSVITVNEWRALEEMDGIGPEGDVRWIASNNMTPVSKALASDSSVDFKRETIKAFIADGTVSDVIANATRIAELVEQSGLPRNPGYNEPWLPVLGDNGQPVTGDVVKDSEGDIVGGATEKPEPSGAVVNGGVGGQAAAQPQDDADGDQDGGKGQVEGSGAGVSEAGHDDEDMPDAPMMEAVRAKLSEAFTGLLADAYARVIRVEADKVMRAVKRADFLQWSNDFYGEHADYVRAALHPVATGYADAVAATFTVATDDEFSRRVAAEVSAMATRHVELSRREIHGGRTYDCVKGWEARPAREAAEDIRTLTEAIQAWEASHGSN